MLKYRLKLKLAVRIIYKNVPVSIQISIQIYGQKHAHEYKPHGWTEQQAVIWREFEENININMKERNYSFHFKCP